MLTKKWLEFISYLGNLFPKDVEIWINHIKYLKSEDNNINIEVPNDVYKQRFINIYLPAAKEWFKNNLNKNIKITIHKSLDLFSKKDSNTNDSSIPKQEEDNSSLNDNLSLKKETSIEDNQHYNSKNLHLKRKNTFDQFVVGPNNQLAYAASQRIAKNPGKDYNPFFIYGGVGLGKTHLIQAIGHEIQKNNPLLVVFYITTEQFTNEYINALNKGLVHQFRLKYRYADILLMDDIQFLEKKEKIQEELFHTFNKLKEPDFEKQMVFSSDRSPRELKTITDRLLSRFSSGLVVDIKAPNFETRKAILKNKVIRYKIDLSDEILDFLADHITENVRDLEAAVIKIKSIKELLNEEISLKKVEEELHEILKAHINFPKVPLDLILEEISYYYDTPHEDIMSKKRNLKITQARQMFILLAKTLTNKSIADIGIFLKGRKHSTISIAYQKINTLLSKSLSIQNDLEQIKSKIRKSAHFKNK